MNAEKTQNFIQELDIFSKMPLTERQILHRVKRGEDLRLIDLNIVKQNYRELTQAFPQMTFYLALKALMAKGMPEALKEEGGTHFEIATIEEMNILLKKGILAEYILFSHPAKDALEIKKAFQAGVKRFVSDSEEDLELLKHCAPKTYVWIRILAKKRTHNKGIEYFDKRFGATPSHAKKLIHLAKKLHLKPKGLSFHPGTQNTDPKSWEHPIKMASQIFKSLKEDGVILDSLNMGGGLPAQIHQKVPSIQKISKFINAYLQKHFQDIKLEEIIMEPGRFLSGMAGVTIGRVIHVKQSEIQPQQYVVTLSTGKASAGLLGIGLGVNFYFEGKNKHPLPFPKTAPTKSAVLFGKASSYLDKIFEEEIKIPADLQSGHFVVFTGTGAYAGELTSNWCSKSKPTNLIFDSEK